MAQVWCARARQDQDQDCRPRSIGEYSCTSKLNRGSVLCASARFHRLCAVRDRGPLVYSGVGLWRIHYIPPCSRARTPKRLRNTRSRFRRAAQSRAPFLFGSGYENFQLSLRQEIALKRSNTSSTRASTRMTRCKTQRGPCRHASQTFCTYNSNRRIEVIRSNRSNRD